MNYPLYQQIFSGKQLPLAYVDANLWEENIRLNLARVGDKKVRIATKSLRCVPLIKELLIHKNVEGVMTFSPLETCFLAEKGIDDLLLGYPCVGTAEILALCAFVQKGKKITFMVDSEAHLRQLQVIAIEQQISLRICFDLDMSTDVLGLHFGVWRSSLRELSQVKFLYEILKTCPNLQLVGVMGYEAQTAGVGDNVQGKWAKNQVVRWLKSYSQRKYSIFRREAVAWLREQGAMLEFVNGGGTGSASLTATEETVTEITIGSGFFSPALFDAYQDFRFRPAMGFALPIVRIPKHGIYTCAGGGYIASGSVGLEKQPQPYLPEGSRLTDLEGAGEVMTPVLYEGNEKLTIGSPLFFRHAKAGELCERFSELYWIRDGKIEKTLPTYRGEGQCFF